MSGCYDRQGRPLDLTAWAEKHADKDYLIVAQHWVRGWMVSTVWLGLNHNFSPYGPPLIFETMIFAPVTRTPGSPRPPSLTSTRSVTPPRKPRRPATTGRCPSCAGVSARTRWPTSWARWCPAAATRTGTAPSRGNGELAHVALVDMASGGCHRTRGGDPGELRGQIREQISVASRAARRAENIAALTGRRPEVSR